MLYLALKVVIDLKLTLKVLNYLVFKNSFKILRRSTGVFLFKIQERCLVPLVRRRRYFVSMFFLLQFSFGLIIGICQIMLS